MAWRARRVSAGVAGAARAAAAHLRQKRLQAVLDGALHGPRAVHRVVAHVGQVRHRAVRQLEAHLAARQTRRHAVNLQPHDALDLLLAQRLKHDVLVHAVDELGAEVRANLQGLTRA